MKYILVSGGVISGVGKGVITSSIGTLLKSVGLKVTAIKIDPYLNIDAGTFSPYEHGEVFVLDDGGEVDLDLGNYERFLDVTLHRDNNITTGKIYQHVIERERNGDYLGKTVQDVYIILLGRHTCLLSVFMPGLWGVTLPVLHWPHKAWSHLSAKYHFRCSMPHRVVPHVTDAIQDWIERVAMVSISGERDQPPDICVIELGGTIGDIEGMPFVEAFRQFQFRVGLENFCNIHVSLVPQPSVTGEQKTKPTQNSVRQLRGLGLSPDLIVCRSQKPISQSVKSKISNFCHVKSSQVVAIHDCSSIYRVPLLLQEQGVLEFFLNRLEVPLQQTRPSCLHKWRNLAERHDSLQQEVKIALVGKYTKLEDAYISVIKALQHAALSCRHRLHLIKVESDDLERENFDQDPIKYHDAWKSVCSADGILVPGGFGQRGTEGKILAVKYARERKIPYLGVCLGLQVAVIEFARNVLGWDNAQSTEFDKDTSHPMVIEMPEHNPGQMGATMRLGKRKTVFTNQSCVIRKLYGNKDYVEERHRHRYEVNPEYIGNLEEKGLKFVGRSVDNQRMEILELEDHPYFVAVQYHPEYQTRPMFPSPPFLGLVMAACKKLDTFVSRNCQLSPRASYEYDSEEDDEVTQALLAHTPSPPPPTITSS